MAISFANFVGSLMNALGRCAGVVKNLRSYQTTQKTAMSVNLVAELAAEPDVQAVTGSGYIGALSSSGGSVGPLMQSQAAAIVNRIVYRDNPRLGQSLTSSNTLASLQEIIRQMKAQNVSVLACTVTATGTAFQGAGDGVINASTVRPYDGLTLENAFSENLNVFCTSDSYSGGATAGNESFTVFGTGSQSDVFAFDWPLGSDAQTSVQAINGSADNAQGNALTNSGWDSWTDGVPDNWEVVVGDTTSVSEITGFTFTGGSSLKLLGNGGSELTKIRQKFGDGTLGTAGTLEEASQHSLCLWMALGQVNPPGAGIMRIALVDGAGVVVKDEAGNDNATSINLTTALTQDFAPFKTTFRTPLDMPDELYLQIELTEALEDGYVVLLDQLGLGPMVQLYVSGPFMAIHSGAEPFELNDYAQLQVTNSRGAGGTLDTWQTAFARLFFSDVMNNELLLPSSATPTISDALITA